MIKLVTVAIWSNFSAHKPAITPIQPSIMDEIKVKKIEHRFFKYWFWLKMINNINEHLLNANQV